MKLSKCQVKPPYPELRGSIDNIVFPAFAEIKTDGEFNFIHIEKNNCFCVNKYGKIKQDFKNLNLLEKIVSRNHSSATFLGEVYGGDGKLGALYELLKNKGSDDLFIHIFDLLQLNGKDLRSEPLLTRLEEMYSISGGGRGQKVVNNKEEALKLFKEITDKGYEGLVIKPFNGDLVFGACDWVKLKYKDQNDYRVSFVDPVLERIEIATYGPSVKAANKYKKHIIGVKAANKYKKHIIVGTVVTIEHQGVLPSGSLRHPVLIPKPEWR